MNKLFVKKWLFCFAVALLMSGCSYQSDFEVCVENIASDYLDRHPNSKPSYAKRVGTERCAELMR